MNLNQWQETFNLLNSDINELKKMINKLNKLHKKLNKKQFNLLLPQVQFQYMYIKELFNKLENQSYWHESNLNLEVWEGYKRHINTLFNYLDNIIPVRR